MLTKTKKMTVVTLPLAAMKYLRKSAGGKKLVCEIDVSAFKKSYKPNAIDEMVAEARLEYALGKTKRFISAATLIKELRSAL